MYGAHLRRAYTKRKEDKTVKAKLKKYMSHVTDHMGIKSSINIFLLNYVLYLV